MKFFEDVFFPYLKNNGITKIIHFGDLFHNRKNINISTLNSFKKRIVEAHPGLEWHLLIGNHDTYYKNTSEVSSSMGVLDGLSNWHVYESPKDILIGHTTLAMIPWINSANKEDSFEFIQNSRAKFAFGHLEITGYSMNAGILCESGLDPVSLKGFDRVFSGHFHKKHENGNVLYVGTPYQMNFGDVNEPKGFHVLDLASGNTDYIENPHKQYIKYFYDDEAHKDIDEDDYEEAKNCFVKIIVVNKTNPKKLDNLTDKLFEAGVASLNIIETPQEPSLAPSEQSGVDLSMDTISIIRQEIDGMESVADKGRLKQIIARIYAEAMGV